MSSRLFAFIIGVDSYKSGAIWNLESCVDDAKNVQRWLTRHLSVPKDQVLMLLDNHATKQAIEDSFMSHLVNNPAIEHGDAILIYFAGHGSTIPAPADWYDRETRSSDYVEVLCPYDHDTKHAGGRIAGIPDRTVHALLNDLSKAKGDNITMMLDCCFLSGKLQSNTRNRRHLRWTPTSKAKPDDLWAGLWVGARSQPAPRSSGFYQSSSATHVTISACRPGEPAFEGKDGGRFTSALLEADSKLSFHRVTPAQLIDHLLPVMSDVQAPVCSGRHRNRLLFNGVPFITDNRYVAVARDNDKRLRIEIGAIHGIVEGSEFSLHLHNYRGSSNLPITNVKITEVHPTWSFCRTIASVPVPSQAWAKIVLWNNRTQFRVHLRRTFCSFFRRWSLRRKLPAKDDAKPSVGCMNMLRVKQAAQSHLSLGFQGPSLLLKWYDDFVAAHCDRMIRLEKSAGALNYLEKAARFHLHLHRRNPANPLRDLVSMEIFRLDPITWKKVGSNLLENGKARITYEQGAIYSIVMHNRSENDLWPALAYMDPNCCGITMLYHPDPEGLAPPLPKSGRLEIGTGKAGSEAISFLLANELPFDSGFLKLFVATSFTAMGIMEQGPSIALMGSSIANADSRPFITKSDGKELWDTIAASVTITRQFSV
ncbi:hypothetical protein HGRIS_002476 [Hohenbuehelia grisea]|uniref:Peptidase C14 caspase domain-containing protein n=1 Tax=Hohenbuehelia grisea TaxID=104357 RepID=A0ABR3JKK5_9AGAR